MALNESPSEKEGKYCLGGRPPGGSDPSMKVPPKRKGNPQPEALRQHGKLHPSMKVPPKRKGNYGGTRVLFAHYGPSMKVPPKRKGNWRRLARCLSVFSRPSMKVPPKRKGNCGGLPRDSCACTLNESPSEKEGKYPAGTALVVDNLALNESPSEKEGKSALLAEMPATDSAPQ